MFDNLITPTHLIFLLGLALLIFGPKRIPEIGSALGRGIRDFRQAMTNLDTSTDKEQSKGSEGN
jgi:sec-independent protein translocase protein TatA